MSKNTKARKKVKGNSCLVCGKLPGDAMNPIDPCHLRTFKVTQSDNELNMIPMCRFHHSQQHLAGWETFFKLYPHVKDHIEKMGWGVTKKIGGGVYLFHRDVK